MLVRVAAWLNMNSPVVETNKDPVQRGPKHSRSEREIRCAPPVVAQVPGDGQIAPDVSNTGS